MRVDRIFYVNAMERLRESKTLGELKHAKGLIEVWRRKHGLSYNAMPIEHAMCVYTEKYKQIVAKQNYKESADQLTDLLESATKPKKLTLWERLCELIK